PQRVLVIGKGKTLEAIRQMASHQPFFRASFLETAATPEELEAYIKTHKILEILVVQGTISSQTILETAALCERLSIECKVIPDLLEMRRGEIILDRFCGLPTFRIKSLSLYGANYVVKRGFDLVVGSFILILFSVPLTLIAIIIHLDSPGPALFQQDRMGFLGRRFKLYKFRTMIRDADAH